MYPMDTWRNNNATSFDVIMMLLLRRVPADVFGDSQIVDVVQFLWLICAFFMTHIIFIITVQCERCIMYQILLRIIIPLYCVISRNFQDVVSLQ